MPVSNQIDDVKRETIYQPVVPTSHVSVGFPLYEDDTDSEDGKVAALYVIVNGEELDEGADYTVAPGIPTNGAYLNAYVDLTVAATGVIILRGATRPRRPGARQFLEGVGVPAADLNTTENRAFATDRELYDFTRDLDARLRRVEGGGNFFLRSITDSPWLATSGAGIDNTVAINAAISDAIAGGFFLFVPGQQAFEFTGNLENFHAMVDLFWGPTGARFKREGVEYYINPRKTDAVYYYADADNGDDTFDGLSPSFPRKTAQNLIDAQAARVNQRPTVNVQVEGNPVGTQDLRIDDHYGGSFYVQGVNPDPTGPTAGINVQPTTVFDGHIASSSTTTVADTTHFPLGFSITPNARASLKIYVDDADVDLSEDNATGDDERGGYKITWGTLTGGVYLSPAVDFLVAIPTGKTVLFEWGLTAGFNITNSRNVYPKHIEFRRYSNKQLGIAASRVYGDNIWATLGSTGYSVTEHSFYSMLGGVINGCRKFGTQELFQIIRHYRRALVADEYGVVDLAASRARGLIIKNCKNIGSHGKEQVTGHADYTQWLDNGINILGSRGCTWNLTGTVLWRSSSTSVIMENGSFVGGGAGAVSCDMGIGTVNANARNWDFDRTSGWISSETSSISENDRGQFGLAGRVHEFMGSFPNDASVAQIGGNQFTTSSTATLGDFIASLSQSTPGWLQRVGTTFGYLIGGEKTGAANTAGVLWRAFEATGPTDTVTTITIPADCTKWTALLRVTSRGPSAQQVRIEVFHNGTAPNWVPADSTMTIPYEDGLTRAFTMRGRVANAGDALKVNWIEALTTDRRQVENIG